MNEGFNVEEMNKGFKLDEVTEGRTKNLVGH